jgi:hypothetical protein
MAKVSTSFLTVAIVKNAGIKKKEDVVKFLTLSESDWLELMLTGVWKWVLLKKLSKPQYIHIGIYIRTVDS